MTSLRSLLVVTHVVHYRHGGRLHAYGPYAREIDMWGDIFPAVAIAAPFRDEPPPGDALPLQRADVCAVPLPERGGAGVRRKLAQLASLPPMAWRLVGAMRRADVVHVRCPGNIGLLGTVLAPVAARHMVAKYAGQWIHYPGEAWSVRLQRWLLGSRWWRGLTTVYGRWPGQPDHVVSFFTSILSGDQLDLARAATADRRLHDPLRVLYVGRLSTAKNVDQVIRAADRLRAVGYPVEVTIVGEGPERASLEALSSALDVDAHVRFTGGIAHEQVLNHYARNDVLVLASETEGWPKAIAEAMAFGMVCIGSSRGLVPEMLGDGRGLTVEPRDLDALVETLQLVIARPDLYIEMSRAASSWALRFSLEHLRDAIRDLLSRRWGVCIGAADTRHGAPRAAA